MQAETRMNVAGLDAQAQVERAKHELANEKEGSGVLYRRKDLVEPEFCVFLLDATKGFPPRERLHKEILKAVCAWVSDPEMEARLLSDENAVFAIRVIEKHSELVQPSIEESVCMLGGMRGMKEFSINPVWLRPWDSDELLVKFAEWFTEAICAEYFDNTRPVTSPAPQPTLVA